MLLNDTNDVVRVVTSASGDIDVHAFFADWDAGAFSPGAQNTNITTATTTTVVAAPSGTAKRQVKGLTIANRHASTSMGIVAQVFDGTNPFEVWAGTLDAGETVVFDGVRWQPYSIDGHPIVYDMAEAPENWIIRAAVDRTLTSSTAEQAMFNNPANGRIQLETGVYFFDWHAIITGMSATSGNARIDILGAGTATLANIMWSLWGLDNTTPATISADLAAYFQVDTSAASAVTAGTGTALRFTAQGMFGVSAAGTLQPALALVTAAAAVVQNGSYFRIQRVGSLGFASSGPWS